MGMISLFVDYIVHLFHVFQLAAHPDQNVKNGAELLDRLIKDIVTESSSFDLVAFVPLLRERIYTKNTFARQFVVSWVSTINSSLLILKKIENYTISIPDGNSYCRRKSRAGDLGLKSHLKAYQQKSSY